MNQECLLRGTTHGGINPGTTDSRGIHRHGRGHGVSPPPRPPARFTRQARRDLRQRRRDPGPSQVGMERRHRHDRPRRALPTGRCRRRGDRHAERHPSSDGRGRGACRQARHVREASGAGRRRRPSDVRGGPRCRRRAHDRVHLSIRAFDAIPAPSAEVGCTRHPAPLPLAAVPGLARDELGLAAISRGPARATCST